MNEYEVVKKLQPIGGSLAVLLPSYMRYKMNFDGNSKVRVKMKKNHIIIENIE